MIIKRGYLKIKPEDYGRLLKGDIGGLKPDDYGG